MLGSLAGEGEAAGGGCERSERGALLPPNPALRGEGGRQGGRGGYFFTHTHPGLLFPLPSACSLPRKLSVPGRGRGGGRPRPAVKNTQRPPPTLWRGRPAAPRGATAPLPPLPPLVLRPAAARAAAVPPADSPLPYRLQALLERAREEGGNAKEGWREG